MHAARVFRGWTLPFPQKYWGRGMKVTVRRLNSKLITFTKKKGISRNEVTHPRGYKNELHEIIKFENFKTVKI